VEHLVAEVKSQQWCGTHNFGSYFHMEVGVALYTPKVVFLKP
jgi:hypothetical protein